MLVQMLMSKLHDCISLNQQEWSLLYKEAFYSKMLFYLGKCTSNLEASLTQSFYSLKVEGAFSSFEVFISDAQVKELIRVRYIVHYIMGHDVMWVLARTYAMSD